MGVVSPDFKSKARARHAWTIMLPSSSLQLGLQRQGKGSTTRLDLGTAALTVFGSQRSFVFRLVDPDLPQDGGRVWTVFVLELLSRLPSSLSLFEGHSLIKIYA